jgi:hypothetical protein
MIKRIILFVCTTCVLSLSAFSEEGMLIPSLIKAFESDMQAMGMKLTAQQIYDVNNSSIKDAVIHFGGGCTAELVSSQGLLLTNHHCGYSQIQSHSSLEKDYLKYGYWAKNRTEELPNPGLTASRMVRIEDVTKGMFFGVNETDTPEKQAADLKKNMDKLLSDATSGNHYEADIKAFNYGNDFYLIVKEVFTDVRFVGTPPNSIGKFGGDTDNWVWPRHTGDFSVFRIYAGKDNLPAAYSAENVPYTPLHFLPISMKTRQVGDFTMVYGFPGSTEQHLVSGQIKYITEKERPARIKMREKSLSVIDGAMRASDEVRIKYSSKQARIANAYKKWIGQVGGLTELGAVKAKLDYEKMYLDKTGSNAEWKEKYGQTILRMNELVASKSAYDFQYAMAIEYLYVGPEVFKMARDLNDLIKNYETLKDVGELDGKIEEMKAGAKGFFKNYDSGVDRRIFQLLTEEYQNQVGEMPEFMKTKHSISSITDLIYDKSVLTNKTRYLEFLDGFKAKSVVNIEKDPGYKFWKSVEERFRGEVLAEARNFQNDMDTHLKTYVEGKLTMFPEAKHWPDANGTMRISYGKLEGSAPTDGMSYLEHTTTEGIIQKHNTGNPDFDLLPELVDLYKKKDFGDYAQNGELWVCFTGSNHTTGGNSGSPVIDAEGNLMGLNFDRSWESTMSDFMFDASRCRNIVVDIRYVLWVMDKFAGAKHLVDEMTLVHNDELLRKLKTAGPLESIQE